MFDNDGVLEINAAKNSSPFDFDFYVGKWRIHNRRLKSELDNCNEWVEFEATDDCYKILKGYGCLNQYRTQFDGIPFDGVTLRLFNPKTKLWSLHWADSSAVKLDTPLVGSFDEEIGKFYAQYVWNGSPIIEMFRWNKTNPNIPV